MRANLDLPNDYRMKIGLGALNSTYKTEIIGRIIG
jgi:hypothetical protein